MIDRQRRGKHFSTGQNSFKEKSRRYQFLLRIVTFGNSQFLFAYANTVLKKKPNCFKFEKLETTIQ